MARQKLGPKKVKFLRKLTGLPIHTALARGGTNHTLLLCLEDGKVFSMYKDGTLQFQDSLTFRVSKVNNETHDA